MRTCCVAMMVKARKADSEVAKLEHPNGRVCCCDAMTTEKKRPKIQKKVPYMKVERVCVTSVHWTNRLQVDASLGLSHLLLGHRPTLRLSLYFLPQLSDAPLVLPDQRNKYALHEERVRAHADALLLYAFLQFGEVRRDRGFRQTVYYDHDITTDADAGVRKTKGQLLGKNGITHGVKI